jgi:hypothetical protein
MTGWDREASGRTRDYPTIADLRQLMSEAVRRQPDEGPRGPVAILATDPELYRRACTYAALGRSRLTIDVFRDPNEAERWLTAQAKAME